MNESWLSKALCRDEPYGPMKNNKIFVFDATVNTHSPIFIEKMQEAFDMCRVCPVKVECIQDIKDLNAFNRSNQIRGGLLFSRSGVVYKREGDLLEFYEKTINPSLLEEIRFPDTLRGHQARKADMNRKTKQQLKDRLRQEQKLASMLH